MVAGTEATRPIGSSSAVFLSRVDHSGERCEGVTSAVQTRVASGRRRGKGIIFAFLVPGIVIYSLLFLYPALSAFRISLYKWQGYKWENAQYVSLDNFREALQDRWLLKALGTNAWFMIVGGILLFILALLFAAVLTNTRYRARTFFKTVIFLPHVINVVGVGLLWVFVLNPRFGILNQALRVAGLTNLAKPWLATPYALHSYTFIIVWYVIGYYMVLLIAGMEGIPTDLYDAAKVDGANEWQVFRSVTLPLLRDVLAVGIIQWMITALKIFGILWATGEWGTSFNDTHTIATYMMMYASPKSAAGFRMGYATTVAVVMCVLVFLVSLLFFRLSRREAIEY
jgi:N-acetylglucosamine transport system permease protein